MNRRHKTFLSIMAVAIIWSLIYARSEWPNVGQPSPKRAPMSASGRKYDGRSERKENSELQSPKKAPVSASGRKYDRRLERKKENTELQSRQSAPMPDFAWKNRHRSKERTNKDSNGPKGRTKIEWEMENLSEVRICCCHCHYH